MSNKNLKPQILALKNQGLTFSQIASELDCSKSTVTYHLGEGQKEKHKVRLKKHRSTTTAIVWKKIKEFRRVTSNSVPEKLRDRSLSGQSFTPSELENKTGLVCYLTGRSIDLSVSSTYSLDHIHPRSKGGNNELINCGLACTPANQAKHSLSLEEFFQLCVDVVKHNNLL